MDDWVSPALGIRFDLSGSELTIFGPEGRPFLSNPDLAAQNDQLASERDRIASERDRLAAQLRAAGIEPSS